MQAFIADSDPDETGRRWKKWKNELLTRFRYFQISNTQDRIAYGGEQIRELIESLDSVPTLSSAEQLNEYEKIIAKLDDHFIPMVNPDCASVSAKARHCGNPALQSEMAPRKMKKGPIWPFPLTLVQA